MVSEIGSKVSRCNTCMARSFMVGMPNGRFGPYSRPVLGIFTRLRGSGR